jgi:hypothetical protein
MAEYISREGAIERIQPHVKPTSVYGEGYMQAIEHAVEILSLMPAADVQPVKRGRWIWDSNAPYREHGAYKCSNCGCHSDFEENYCYNCGARMKQED